ncbi:CARDB domain-containing protein [Archangium lipolyticum]|uniref:CARDB domain-containing protein n=1 Tax=Archangium lipolyticum TaxID=2970465 RepID=UPI002149E699|nr:CARDB domain-containing protein [Archangium lipolyticum]
MGRDIRWARALVASTLLGAVGCGETREQEAGPEEPGALVAAVGEGPDFFIQQVSAPPSVSSGVALRVGVTVCNRGGSSGDPGVVELVLSKDAIITAGQDLSVGSVQLATLVPGECAAREVLVTANVVSGSWFVGAIADRANWTSELSETNNTLAGGQVGVGSLPDFVIREVRGRASAQPGQPMPVSVVVCNQGTKPDSTSLSLMLSQDEAITTADQSISASVSAPTVNPGQCAQVSITGTVPSVPQGAWYLGAYADRSNVKPELIETNNGRGTLLGVGSRPDFVITEMKGIPKVVAPGDSFTPSITVCNPGTAAASTQVELFLSKDASLSRDQDLRVGSFPVSTLAPGACTSVPANVIATVPPPSQGELYLGAIVDPSNSIQELIESNNAFTTGTLAVGVRPDFVVAALTGPVSAMQGESLGATVTVCNQGQVGGATEVELYLSKDAVILPPAPVAGDGDIFVARASVDPLEPGQCRTLAVAGPVSFPYTFPDGEYRLGAIVDPRDTAPELLEGNNSRAGGLLRVGQGPDFAIREVSVPPSVKQGAPLSISLTMCNQGTVPDSSYVMLVLSPDARLSPPGFEIEQADQTLSYLSTGTLLPGQCVPVTTSVSAQSFGAEWYLGALIDPYNSSWELLESNNVSISGPLGVGDRPDFVVTKVVGPASARPGGPLTAAVTVCNQGTAGADTQVRLLLSSDPALSSQSGQMLTVAENAVGVLAPGACKALSMNGGAPSVEGPFHLAAIVDPFGSRQELIESNNTRVGGQLGLGHRPDFVVTEVTGPEVVRPGESFTASITVCNQGTVGMDTDVALLLSSNEAVIPPGTPAQDGDVYLGEAMGPLLPPGECGKVPVQATFLATSGLPPGEYHLSAIADPGEKRVELLESNNAFAGKRVGWGDAPDFIVKALTGSSLSRPGENFPVFISVCNQGTTSGDAEVLLVLSSDTVITGPRSPGGSDVSAGRASLGLLAPGQCVTHRLTSSIESFLPQGSWYLGAIVDPLDVQRELFERNNTRVGDMMGSGYGPDLIVKKVVGPANARPDALFTVSATVCNQGTQPGGSDVLFLLSEDEVLGMPGTSADFPLGSSGLNGLAPGVCASVSAQVRAPMSGVAWHLGAIVDPHNSLVELLENNNARVGEVMGIGDGPDFIVSKVSGPVNVRPGDTATLSATVCNQGTASGATEVMMLLSSSPAVASPTNPRGEWPTPLGTVPVRTLGVGECTTVSLRTPLPEGSWYLSAGADPLLTQGELIESNNFRVGGPLGVGTGPDFVIQEVSAPPSVFPGYSFSVSATVCNQGFVEGSTDVGFFASFDTVPGTPGPMQAEGDFFLGQSSYVFLGAGQCAQVPLSTSLPQELYEFPGTYNLGAVADVSNIQNELVESNNASGPVQVGVGFGPDFTVQEVSGPATVRSGASFHVTATVCNQGIQEGSTDVLFVLSSDPDISLPAGAQSPGGDVFLGNTPLGYLPPGQCVPVEWEVSTSLQGSWYLGAIVDPTNFQREFIESNNARAGVRMGFGDGPDFVVTQVSGPSSVRPGDAFTASATVCNQGHSSGSTDVALLLSRDEVILAPGTPLSEWDVVLASAGVGSLEPGQCSTVPVSAQASASFEGVWYLGAIADPANGQLEVLEHNNASSGGSIGIGSLPDFAVTAVTGPASRVPGALFTASVTVCNQGTVRGSTDLALLLSSDAVISLPGPQVGGDTLAGSAVVGPLEPGQCTPVAVSAQAPSLPDGTYHLGAIADPVDGVPEFLESNNAHAGALMGIGHAPDLIVTAVTGPVSARTDGSFTVSVTVCNQGTEWGHPQVAVFVSPDPVISGQGPSSDDIQVDSFFFGSLAPEHCDTVRVRADLNFVPEGTYTLGAVVDPDNEQLEFIENNNAHAGGQMVIGNQPDLVVQSVTGPANVELGSSFQALVTVCNQGTVPSITTEVLLALSADEVIAPPGYGDFWPSSTSSVGPLPGGQCVTVPVSAQASVAHGLSEGVYHLGAFIDPYERQPELSEENNARASGLFGIGVGTDFVVTAVTAPTSVEPWAELPVSVTVCNQGTRYGSASVDVVLSKDTTIDWPDSSGGDDFFLGSVFAYLSPGTCETRPLTSSVSVSVPEGVYHVGTLIRSGGREQELITSNDTYRGGRVGVGYQPDLVIEAVSLPARLQPGASISGSATVCNRGLQRASSHVVLVLFKDESPSVPFEPYGDVWLASGNTGPLPAGQCVPVEVSGSVPYLSGAWRMGAFVDPDGNTPEFFEDNNVFVSGEVSMGTGVDFAVTEVTGPASVRPGMSFDASITVCNQGDDAASTTVELVFSSDTSVHPSSQYPGDVYVSSATTGQMFPGQCRTIQLSDWTPSLAKGRWYLGGIVDPAGQHEELLESNNALVGGPVTVQ